MLSSCPARRRVLALVLMVCALPAARARAGTAMAMSDLGSLDTLAPRFTLLAPEPGAVLVAGELVLLGWSVADANLPALLPGVRPLRLTVRVDGVPVHADSLGLGEGAGQPLGFTYAWTVSDTPTQDCRWAVALADAFGNPGGIESEPHRIATAESPADALAPARVTLAPNWPNPFNPSTRLRFGLPQAGWARLSIYDLRGREVERLWDGRREAGWLELEWRPRGLASGVYFAQLLAGETRLARKLVLLK
jgi:hypothetical protein